MTGRKKLGIVGKIYLTVAVLMTLGLCQLEAREASTDVEAPVSAKALPAPLPRQDFPEPVLGSLRTAFGAYEKLRSELAADRLAGVPASAAQLATTLRLTLEDRAKLPGQIPVVIEEAARIAESMAAAEDIVAARTAFGELSRIVLLLGDADPRLAEGWHVFACPMTKTFDRWIQPTAALKNPYMGAAMPLCGSPVDWAMPLPASVEAVEAASPEAETDRPEPVFKPGIPGVQMVDVRDHRFLWREIEELQTWERSDRLSVAEYRSKVIEKTAHFLGLSGAAADEFTEAAFQAVARVRTAFQQKRLAERKASGAPPQFSTDLRTATTQVTALLKQEPRHQLFAPDCKKWLLKLAFGPREAKEAREAKAAKRDGMDTSG